MRRVATWLALSTALAATSCDTAGRAMEAAGKRMRTPSARAESGSLVPVALTWRTLEITCDPDSEITNPMPWRFDGAEKVAVIQMVYCDGWRCWATAPTNWGADHIEMPNICINGKYRITVGLLP